MIFSSAVFLTLFLPLFLLFNFIINKKLKNYNILFFSLVFYAWGAPTFLFYLLASIVLNFYIVRAMDRQIVKSGKRWLLSVSVIINVGMLAYFKYANFFVENVNQILHSAGFQPASWTAIALPIGISFFTFQSLTYGVDVYRKVHKPLDKISDYALYIMMFPQMIAGPIVRFNTIANEIIEREEKLDTIITGFYRFVIGLAKKVLIANVMGEMADNIMGMDYMSIDSTTAWIGILAYTFQIYFDFAGYSDMAIGIGKMIGFNFPENFNNPYVSKSISEFWRRWHMTLGAWMKDYLYIPLGGNRVASPMRLYFNLWFVFLISGFWHGASWNFVIWGAYHGIFLILDRIFLLKLLSKIGKIPSTIFTFFIAIMGWVIFRIENFDQAMLYYSRLFAFDFSAFDWAGNGKFFVFLIIAILFSFCTMTRFGLRIQDKIFYNDYTNRRYIIMAILSLVLFILSLSSVTSSGFNPFIYYRF